MIPDSELISRIKDQADSEATLELINRHSGVYINMVNRYSFSSKVSVPELKEDRVYNIFSWVKDFDPSRNVKFGSYVGERTKWMCLNMMSRGADSVELDERTPNTDFDTQNLAERHTDIAEIRTEAQKVKDPLFWKIFKLRFDSKKPRSWRAIAEVVDLSHEGARKYFLKYIGSVKTHMAT